MKTHADAVLNYWFGGDLGRLGEEQFGLWFRKSEQTDSYIRDNFGALVAEAGAGKLDAWLAEPYSAVAWMILLDQFSRNIFRGSADMYQYDAPALEAAKATIRRGFDFAVPPHLAVFLYLPFEHAEDLACQEASVLYFKMLRRRGPRANAQQYENFLAYAEQHYEVVARFGRFPHRNVLLGRESTPAEELYLKLPGSGF